MIRNDFARGWIGRDFAPRRGASGVFGGAFALLLGLTTAACASPEAPIPVVTPLQATVAAPNSEPTPEDQARLALACALEAGRFGFAEREGALFTVEIAADRESQNRGLMWRESLAPDAGMLFIFDPPRQTQFWMKNTLIPLDMIFLDPLGRIQHIERKAVPQTLEARGPAQAVSSAVLEIAGGRAAELGLELGDRALCPPVEEAL